MSGITKLATEINSQQELLAIPAANPVGITFIFCYSIMGQIPVVVITSDLDWKYFTV